MAITLPTPLRVAAGIVASGIELVRSLPEELPALPVTLVGKAMQLSMKVQQEIAELATKGDELLSGVLGSPQENPPWAHFDDEPLAKPVSAAPSPPKPAGAVPSGAGSARAGAVKAGTTPRTPRVAEGGKAPVVTPLARSASANDDDEQNKDAKRDKDAAVRKSGGAKDAAAQSYTSKVGISKADSSKDDNTDAGDASDAPPGLTEADHAATLGAESSNGRAGASADAPAGERAAEPDAAVEVDGTVDADDTNATDAPVDVDGTIDPDETDDDAPAALPDYDRMTLAQVRGYLRSLSATEVQSLLDHEQSGENRAPFLTLLSNRLVTLEHQES